jgi:triacylglycerol lipase
LTNRGNNEELIAIGRPGPILRHREMRRLNRPNRPIWLEAGAVLEWGLLHTAPVYFGLGVTKGDGKGVVLVPGFLGTDTYLWEMHLWLHRIGYHPFRSEIGWNAECLNTLVERLTRTVRKANAETGRKVHLIGHSLGGILARAVAVQMPERVASIITLGSPFRGICAHPLVFVPIDRVGESVRRRQSEELREQCFTAVCGCNAVSALGNDLPGAVPHLAVYSKTDGIVDWQFCTHDDPTSNIEVRGTHIGMVFNHQVYSLIASHLARHPGGTHY